MIRALPVILALGACAEATQAVDDVARRSAKAAVAETLATRFPAVPQAAVTPFTDCIIDNSGAAEIRIFAKAAVVGVEPETVDTVRRVLEQPETVSCISRSAANLL